jgi:hypothetical protein
MWSFHILPWSIISAVKKVYFEQGIIFAINYKHCWSEVKFLTRNLFYKEEQ